MLAITTRLRFGAYDAGRADDSRQPEWPPHPARVFCALVASGPSEPEWAALRWLERQDSPTLVASRLLDSSSFEQFVPTNEVKASSPNLPGRANASRTKPRALPEDDRFTLVWQTAHPNHSTVQALDDLARRVGYVGRATSSAEVLVTIDMPTVPEDSDTYEPATTGAEVDLAVPYRGYCDELQAQFEDGRRAWEVRRLTGYQLHRPAPPAALALIAGPFDRMLIFELRRDRHLHASLTAIITEATRNAVMDLLPDPPPDEISGHGDAPHVAFLTLPNVGQGAALPDGPHGLPVHNPNADGRILAVALAMPTGFEQLSLDLYRKLVGTGAGGLDHLTLGRYGRPGLAPQRYEPALTYQPVTSDRWGATARRWTRPATFWATATPLVFDRFPKRRSPAAMVADALVTAGYPEPLRVVAHRSPILPGAPQLARSQVRRRTGMPVKPWVHAWVQFAEPQHGPVLAGSMRNRGLGLFAPLDLGPTERASDVETAQTSNLGVAVETASSP